MSGEPIRDVERRLNVVETRNAVEDVHRMNVESRLTSIEDALKWLVRVVVGALLLGLIGYALGGGFASV